MYKRTIFVTFILSCTVFSYADTQMLIPIWDRIGEADLVVVGTVDGLDIIKLPEKHGNVSFLPVAAINVSEVMKGVYVKPGDKLTVGIGEKQISEAMARLESDSIINSRAIWLLRKNPYNEPVHFLQLERTTPDKEKNWQSYIKQFYKSAEEFAHYNSILKLKLFIQPREVEHGLLAMASVILDIKGESVRLPSECTVQIELINSITNSKVFGSLKNTEVKPGGLKVLNIIGFEEGNVPENITKQLNARILIRVTGIDDINKATKFFCIARLLDNRARTLVKTDPAVFYLVKPELAQKDIEMMEEVSRHNLWYLLGPHNFVLTEEQLAQLRMFEKKYAGCVLIPAVECGLAFSKNPEITDSERIDYLKALLNFKEFGYNRDCLNELVKQLRKLNREEEAEKILKEYESE